MSGVDTMGRRLQARIKRYSEAYLSSGDFADLQAWVSADRALRRLRDDWGFDG